MHKRTLLLNALLLASTCLAVSTPALAQTWPSKPIRLVIPYAAGGPTDVIGRKLGVLMSERLGQPVIIDNKAGAGGTIGVDFVIKSVPDGHTLALVAPGPVAGMPALGKVPYTQAEIQYLTLVARNPSVIGVNTKSGINSLGELVKVAKDSPGKLNFGSAGLGTTPHIGSELFKQEAQIDVIHVAYKGTAPATTALMAGEVQFMTNDLMAMLPHAQSGAIKILAVAGSRRVAQIPDVPTTAELGLPKVLMETNYGLLGPRGMPAEVQKKIQDTVADALNTPTMKELLTQLGAVAVTTTSDGYRSLMQSEYEKWKGVAAKGNIRLD
jgi:tripartite-type tricarboxylate transporter receptor subunit TctC